MRQILWAAAVAVLLAGCVKETPQRVSDANLGFTATFPGAAKLAKHAEPSPYGEGKDGLIEWFDTAHYPAGRLDENFRVEVGNLPPGKQGGDTPAAVAETFRKDLERRFGKLTVTELPKDQGPGFRYTVGGPHGSTIGGLLVVRRARLHHAQATVREGGDARLKAFLDSVEIAK